MKIVAKVRVAQTAQACYDMLADYCKLVVLRPSSTVYLIAGEPGKVGATFTESLFVPADEWGVIHERRTLVSCDPARQLVWAVSNDTGIASFTETITFTPAKDASGMFTDIDVEAVYDVPLYYWLLYLCIAATMRPRLSFSCDTLRMYLEGTVSSMGSVGYLDDRKDDFKL